MKVAVWETRREALLISHGRPPERAQSLRKQALVTRSVRERQDQEKYLVGNVELPTEEGEAHCAFKWHQRSWKARGTCQSRRTQVRVRLPTTNYRNL